jgi:hypothetical protein
VNGIPFPFRDGMRGRAKLLDERKLQRVASYSDAGIEVISATQTLESLVNCLVKQRGSSMRNLCCCPSRYEKTAQKLLLEILTIPGMLIIRGGNHTVIKRPSNWPGAPN